MWEPKQPEEKEGICDVCLNNSTHYNDSDEKRIKDYLKTYGVSTVVKSNRGWVHKAHIGKQSYFHHDMSYWVACPQCGLVYESEGHENGIRLMYKGQYRWICRKCIEKMI